MSVFTAMATVRNSSSGWLPGVARCDICMFW